MLHFSRGSREKRRVSKLWNFVTITESLREMHWNKYKHASYWFSVSWNDRWHVQNIANFQNVKTFCSSLWYFEPNYVNNNSVLLSVLKLNYNCTPKAFTVFGIIGFEKMKRLARNIKCNWSQTVLNKTFIKVLLSVTLIP